MSSTTTESPITIQRVTLAMGGQPIAIHVTGDPVTANNGYFYFHTDHLGSTSYLTKSTGSKLAGSDARYQPFGLHRTTPSQTITDTGFTGQKENRELGLIYYNARYYAPTLARFISPDTLIPDPAHPQAFNRYSYVLNNPTRFTDPTGHICYDPNTDAASPGNCNGGNTPQPPRVTAPEPACDDVWCIDDNANHTSYAATQACAGWDLAVCANPSQYPSDQMVNALTNMIIDDIGKNFVVNPYTLRQNIVMLLLVGIQYGLSSEELAYLLSTAFGETRFGAGLPGTYWGDLVENIDERKANQEYGAGDKKEQLGNWFEGDGWTYIGRGFVQLTGRGNYQEMQNVFGYRYRVNMVSNPSVVATDPRLAAEIAVYGMMNGSFTGYSFADAWQSGDFYYNARQIINGTSYAWGYAQRAQFFHTFVVTYQ